jgi:hypothetical protein
MWGWVCIAGVGLLLAGLDFVSASVHQKPNNKVLPDPRGGSLDWVKIMHTLFVTA